MVYRIDDPTAVSSPPAVPAAAGLTPGYFYNGNPVSGQAATLVPDWWLNMVQAELQAPVVSAGLTPDKTNNSQLLAAIQALAKTAASGAVVGSPGVLAPGDVAGGVLYYSSALSAPAFIYGGTTVALQKALGFTPTRQGGGTGMGSNAVSFGAASDGSSRIVAQIDATTQGKLATLTDTQGFAFSAAAQATQQVAITLAFVPPRNGYVAMNCNFGCDNGSATVSQATWAGDTSSYTNLGGDDNHSGTNLWVSNRLFAVTAGKEVQIGLVITISTASPNLFLGGNAVFVATA